MHGLVRLVPSIPEEPHVPERPSLGMIGSSAPMQTLRRQILRLAPLAAPVLVTGETGTGKELVARALHDASPRASGPFVALQAGAMTATLIASELFGHERGAFTGATHRHEGVFVEAHRGTLLIDELAELPLDLQAWLLRVLETGEVRPLGAERTRHVDVRVVAATHVDLEEAVRQGRFRADLYWRLAVLTLRAPALRERADDLAQLAEHLLASFGLTERRKLAPDALQALALHDWPGNVRELRAVLLRAVALSSNTPLGAADIVRAIGGSLALRGRNADDETQAMMARTRGNIAEAARRLGVPRSTLRDRVHARRRRVA